MSALYITLAILCALAVALVLAALRMSGQCASEKVDEAALEGDLTGYVHDLNKGSK